MTPIEQVNDFLTRAETFYLTTIDGDRPKCRPIAFHMLTGEKLFFGVGDFKAVYRQMRANPNVELCATVGNEFLRYFGRAVFEPDDFLARQVLSKLPTMQRIYNDQTGYGLALFHLEEATAEFRTMTGIRETFSLR